jgi:small subunit ribosomal protein S14
MPEQVTSFDQGSFDFSHSIKPPAGRSLQRRYMAKKSVVLRNEKRRKMSDSQWKLRKELREQAINPRASDEDRDQARWKLQSLRRNGATTRVRNRCQFTGRSRGIIRRFMLSRITFREMALKGLIPGVTKSSW